MADIELVIKVPEESYNFLKSGYFIDDSARSGKTILQHFCRAIYNGKKLPKGHGNLIDATILRKDFVVSARFNGTWNLGKTRILSHIDDAKTIIEADAEGVDF